jgi:1-acyl-sn-glycerol-3-phosphate acyltransferase
MTTRKKKRTPKETLTTPANERFDDADASERLIHAEGADIPQQPPRRSLPQEDDDGPVEPPPGDLSHGGRTADFLGEGEVPTGELAAAPHVVERIRELEARLDRMIGAHERKPADGVDAASSSQLPSAPPSSTSSVPAPPEGVFDTARELLSTDFYLRKWGRLGLRNRAEEVDEFGYDPVYEQRLLPLLHLLYERYFRVEVNGAERVPAEGRCLLVANHSGTLPLDGVMLRLAVQREHPQHRSVRWLAEDVIFHFPFLGSIANRIGAVRACQENAERLLGHDALVAVFPEGMKGIGKLFKDRYRLQRFGRGGFVKLALRTRTPIVPVAIIGGEETNPMLTRLEYLTKVFGLSYLPVTPTFPLLGPLGLMPAPTKWKIFFGEPVDLSGYGAEAAEDEILVGRLTESVRSSIQESLDRAVRERRSVWFG